MERFFSNFYIWISKVLLVLTVLQLVYIDTKDINIAACVSNVKEIQYEIATKMTLYTQGLWRVTPADQNIQFFPIIETIGSNLALVQIYYEHGLRPMYPKNKFLELPFELASLLDKLQQTSNAELRFKNALFYDNCCTNKEYLDDLKLYYHSELIRVFLASNNFETTKYAMENWLSKNTRNRQPQNEDLLIPELSHFRTSVLQFTACWSKPKMIADELVFNFNGSSHRRSRRFISVAKLPTVNFENASQLDVEAFKSDAIVWYYNDIRLGFEAVRLPFKKDEFSMMVLLPYKNQDLNIFVNFTADNYLQLTERVKEKAEHIEYTIPILNIPMVSMNENGIKINAAGPIECEGLAKNEKRPDTKIFRYKQFVVDRPFGVFIYHERTKFVLWQAWIRDPTSDVYVSRKFLKYANGRSKVIDRNHIS